MDKLKQDAATVTYRDVEALINKICWAHYRKVGGEFDEIKAQANLLFLAAYASTDDIQSSFITWLFISIRFGLMSWTRSNWRRYKNNKRAFDVMTQITPVSYEPEAIKGTHPLQIEAKYNESETIRTVLGLIFDPPNELALKLAHYEDPIYVHDALKSYLLLELGWSKHRIKLAFHEIRRLINVHEAFAISE